MRAPLGAATAAGLGIVGGGLLVTQSRVNGRLTDVLAPGGAALPTALVSLVVGGLATGTVLLAGGSARRVRQRLHAERPPWWGFCGGIGGAALVTMSAVAVPEIGVALTSVFVVVGQTAGALVADRVGLGPSGRHALSPARLAGAVLAVLALALGASGRAGSAQLRPAVVVGVVLAGVLVAGQQALNGRLVRHSGSASYAATVSFAGASLVVLVLTLAAAGLGRLPHLLTGGPPWVWIGGLGGATYISLSALAVPVLGVLRLSLASVAGQLAAGLALDLAVPTAGTDVTAGTYAAIGLTLAGLLVSGSAGRGRRPDGSGLLP